MPTFTGTGGPGQGGRLTVRARDSIVIAGRDSEGFQSGFFNNAAFGTGRAGDLFISTPRLEMTGGRIVASSEATSSGHAGNLTVEVGQLVLGEGAQISSSSFGTGQGGTVSVTATDAIAITGQDSAGFPSGLFSNAVGRDSNAGNAGNLTISAPVLTMDGGRIVSNTVGEGNAGNIDVQVGTLTLTGGGQLFNGTGSLEFINGVPTFTGTGGPGRGGNLTIRATDSVVIAGRDNAGVQSGLFSNAQFGTGRSGDLVVSTPRLEMTGGVILASSAATSSGNAGNLTVEVGQLVLREGAQIDSSSFGAGQGGTVLVTATDTISITGRDRDNTLSGLFSSTFGSGNAGRVIIAAPTLAMDDGVIQARAGASGGDAGAIVVTAERVTLTGGAQIDSRTEGQGQGGSVSVTAMDTLRIAGRDRDGIASGLTSTTSSPLAGAGAAGTITVSARALEMDDGVIQASSRGVGDAGAIAVTVGSLAVTGGAQIASNTFSTGQGGTVTVSATDAVTISGQDSSLSTSSAGPGQGGDITLQARQVQLTDGAVVSAESSGAGNAGSLTITASDTVLMRRHSAVTTEATQADGGDILITAQALVRLQDSTITATVGGGAETVGGNITIDPDFIVLQGSQVIANAFEGRGGNISLVAGVLLRDPVSIVSA